MQVPNYTSIIVLLLRIDSDRTYWNQPLVRPRGTLQTHIAVPDRCQHMSRDQHTYCMQLQFHQQNHTSNSAADHYFGVAVLTSGSAGTFSTDWLLKQASPCPYGEVLSLFCSGATTFGKLPQTGYWVILSTKQPAWPQHFWVVLSSTKGISRQHYVSS